MKILFLVSGSIKSNLTYRALFLARSLAKKGHKISIFAPKLDKYSKFQEEIINEIDGVNIIYPFQFNTTSRILNLIPYMVHASYLVMFHSADIIHIFKPSPITVIGLIPKLLKKTPTIVDMDDLGSKVMQLEGNNFLIIKITQLCELISLKFSDGISCASSYLEQIYRMKFPEKFVKWISNGIDERFYSSKFIYKKIPPSIIVIGSLNRKNIVQPLFYALQKILETDKSLKDISIKIIGDGQSLPYFKNLSKKLNLDKNINFLGWVDIENIPQFISTGDLGYAYMPDEETILASSNLKLFQYMAMGVVPIVSTVGDLPYYVDYGKIGYIAKKNDINDLTSILHKALQDNNGRPVKARIAKEYTKGKYSWDSLSLELEKMYEKITKI